ncbi:MAG TPA: UTP--glucose-1-phosphate uridylyltransferase [Solirubrobacteraceae bacterium]
MAMDDLEQGVQKLRDDGAGEAVIAAFRAAAERLRSGDRGVLREADLEPVGDLPDADALAAAPADVAGLLDRTVVLKLNGGLGTSMGMTRAKSLLEVKDGLSFLEISVRQVLGLRARHAEGGAAPRLPLVLMNSFATRADSLAALAGHHGLSADLSSDIVQSRVPKLLDDGSLAPVSWPADPELEWAPPGHGDLYPALASSGMLATLIERGYRWAFVSNADNLGAVLDPRILAWFAAQEIPFLMEVADRTAADRKGGHLARRAGGGGLVLREVAQTDPGDLEAFQDIARHRFFNTNTIWLDLAALAARLERDGFLDLPMIVNHKTVDPADPRSPKVVQLESAMGAAIDAFEGAQALRVPRSRFIPVKTTDDLLVLRSDAYELADDARVVLAAQRGGAVPLVRLDPEHYRLVADFEQRFPGGPPSLAACDALSVSGDVRFGRGVVVRGSVTLDRDAGAPGTIPNGTVLEG